MVPHPSFGCAPPAMSPFTRPRLSGGPEALTTAAAAVAEFLNTRKMPLILAGRRARWAAQTVA
jgi:thiamine pyrophosphate-dependent acetolactate synthase large subunit-like protein